MGTRSHRFAELDRPPLLAGSAAEGLLRVPGGWWQVRVVETTGSTNADLAAAVRAGRAGPGDVLVAEAQQAGRGRLDRVWCSPPRAGLLVSAALALVADPWVPLLAGLAIARSLAATTGLEFALKWPNDLLVGEAKVAGLLCEALPGVVVVGIGLNVSTRRDELPTGVAATSLALVGAATTDRRTLLLALLRGLESVRALTPGDYRAACATVGREVLVSLPDGTRVRGRADGIDDAGRLLVAGRAFAAADVTQLR